MNIVIFPPLGGSLDDLARSGQLGRFKEYYLKKYQENFSKVYLINYVSEKEIIPGIIILDNAQNEHRYIWQLLIPFIFRQKLKDIIHRVMQLDGILPAVISKCLNGGKIAVTYGYDYKKFAWEEKKYFPAILYVIYEYLLLPFADLIIVPNKNLSSILNSRLPLKNKIVNLPNGVDTVLFHPPRNHQQIQKENINILSVGRLEKQKNYDFLITSFGSFLSRKKVRLTIIGEGKEKDNLISLAKNLHVQLNIISPIPNEQLATYYQNCDIYIQPSLFEGSPKTLIEALACGCKILASNVAGNREVVSDEENGLLFDLTENQLLKKLKRILENHSLADNLSRNARTTALQDFDIHKIITSEVAFLKKI